MIITIQDFKAVYQIAVTPAEEDKIEAILAEHEETIMLDLVGDVIYQEILDSTLGGGANTPSPELIKIFDKFREKIGCAIVQSQGMKVMIAKMIYFEISKGGVAGNTPFGDRKKVAEISEGIDTTTLKVLHNEGMRTYNAIQYYIVQNKEDYPDFSGVKREFVGLF